jgi:hypothetical protein
MSLHPVSIRRTLLAAALALPAGGCSGDADAPRWRGSVRQVGAAVEVQNPDAPMFRQGAAAQPLWSAAGEPDGAGRWDRPVRVALGGGELYVLDQVAHTVHVLSRDGRALRRIGREGKGPGELESPYGLAFVAGQLAVGDGNAVELFSPAGQPAGAMELGTVPVSLVGAGPGGVLVKTFQGQQRVYDLRARGPYLSIPGFLGNATAKQAACYRAGTAGADILRLDCTSPVFEVLSPQGTVRRTVRVDRKPQPASRDELERYRSSLMADVARAGYPGADPSTMVNRLLDGQSPKRMMRGIRYDSASALYAVWEQQPQELGNGPARLHLFGRAGAFLATVPFPEPWVDFAVDGLTVYALAEDAETGLVRLAAYRLALDPGIVRAAAAPLEPQRS